MAFFTVYFGAIGNEMDHVRWSLARGHLCTVDVHVLSVLAALAAPGPGGTVGVVVLALASPVTHPPSSTHLIAALLARHWAARQHPARIPRALAQPRPGGTVPAPGVGWVREPTSLYRDTLA